MKRLCILTLLLFVLSFCKESKAPNRLKYDYKINENQPPTINNIIEFAKQIGIIAPTNFIRIAIKESGHFKSYKWKKYNNFTGMKFAKQRKTFAIGKMDDNSAIYETWQDCVKDYKLWEDQNIKFPPIKYQEKKEYYLHKLDQIYNDTGYSNTLKYIKLRNVNILLK